MYKFLNNISFTLGSPRYLQLAMFLERAIKENLFDSKFLPPERELAKQLNVSRVTISRALKELEDKNLIVRQQGLGTQINSPFDYSLNQLSGFTKRMQEAGYSVSDQWLERKKIFADQTIAQQLTIPENTEIAFLHRVRLIDNIPIAIESTYTLLDLLPDPEDFMGSLYSYWAKNHIHVAKKTIYFNAISCDKKTAQLLHQQPNAPLLKIYEINKNQKGQTIEVSEIKCLSQYYGLKLEINT